MKVRFVYRFTFGLSLLFTCGILLSQPPPCDFEMEVEVEDECGDQCGGSITVLVICPGCTGVLYSIDGGVTVQEDNTFHDLCSGIYDVFAFDEVDDECFSFMEIELGSIIPLTYYKDMDGDGFGDPQVSMLSCSIPIGYVLDNTDTDDSDPCTPACHDPLCAHSIRLSDITAETKCKPDEFEVFYIDVILNMGLGQYTISNNINSNTTLLMPGEVGEIGPFNNDIIVDLTITNDENPTCTIDLPALSDNCEEDPDPGICNSLPPTEIYVFEKPGQWSNPSNWRDNKYPGSLIKNDERVDIIANCDITSMTITNFGSLNLIAGILTVKSGGSIDNFCAINVSYGQLLLIRELLTNRVSGSILNKGNFEIESPGTTFINEGYVINFNEISNTLGAEITNKAGGSIVNNGQFRVSMTEARLINYGNFMNNSFIINSLSGKLHSKTGGKLENYGSIGNIDPSSIINNEGELLNFSDATLRNSGELNNSNAGIIKNEGTIDNMFSTAKFENRSSIVIHRSGELNNSHGGSISNLETGNITNDGYIVNGSISSPLSLDDQTTFSNEASISGSGKFLNTAFLSQSSKASISCQLINFGFNFPPFGENHIQLEFMNKSSTGFIGIIENEGLIIIDADEAFENGSLVNNYGIIEVNGSAINYSCAIIINDNTITNNHRFKNQGIIYQNGNMTGVNNGLIIVNNLCLDATQDISLGISSEGVIVSAVDLFIPEAVDNCLEIFIDGQQSKTYFEPGEYIETITVTDELGNSVSCERIIHIADYIPTLSQWGLIILGTMMLIFGVVGTKQQSLSYS